MKRIPRQFSLGISAIFIAAVIFGVAGAFAKALFHADISPIDLTAVRSLVACGIFALMMLVTQPRAFRIKLSSAPLLIATGLAFTAVNVTFYLSISMISVAAAITLEYTAPFFVLIIGLSLKTRRFDMRDLGIVILSIVGCFLLSGSEAEIFSSNIGILVGLICGLSFAVFNMLGNACKQQGLGASTVTLYAFIVSAIVWAFLLPLLSIDEIEITREVALYLGFITVVATVVPYWLLMYGLRYVDALPATVIGMLDPLVAGFAAFVLLGERLTLANMVGIVIVIIAVCLISIKEGDKQDEETTSQLEDSVRDV
ncbi:membrane protein [Litchfieldella qijiaojingensis]|uniref:Membrane protein n=1 Tax=Litchfieldella qijiaojingensis TaxID=980347 RepID=A0ABQ2ZEU7_9GAMM|nr:EamA family transporter [Halomonas qijiaojingensis]GGY10331.1 membrane protein [Halomonas qijiaojingensis]